jgi:hypothetical protein
MAPDGLLNGKAQELDASQGDMASAQEADMAVARAPQDKYIPGILQKATLACSSALHGALAVADAEDAALRVAAVEALEKLLAALQIAACDEPATGSKDVSATHGRVRSLRSVILTGEQVARLCQMTCERLSDRSEDVARKWSDLLEQLAPHLGRLATGIGTPSPASITVANIGQAQPEWRVTFAMQRQRQTLPPAQISRLLEWLTQSSPNILARPPTGPAIILRRPGTGAPNAEAQRKDDVIQWLIELRDACPLVDTADNGALRCSPVLMAVINNVPANL